MKYLYKAYEMWSALKTNYKIASAVILAIIIISIIT